MALTPPPIRVVIVDDHHFVRRALSQTLAADGSIQVVGEAGTMVRGIAEAIRLAPDVVLMDVRLPDGSGLDACRRIREESPTVQVLMLSSAGDDAARRAAMDAGASGYMLKDLDVPRLQRMILSLMTPGADGEPRIDTPSG